METNQHLSSTVLLALPGWNPQNTVLEITSRYIDTIELPPNDHFLVFRPEDESDPIWWHSPDIVVKYKAATPSRGIELQFPLFQICSQEGSSKSIYKHVVFVCRERYLNEDSFRHLLIEESGTGIMLALQREFMDLCRPIKLQALHQTSSELLN